MKKTKINLYKLPKYDEYPEFAGCSLIAEATNVKSLFIPKDTLIEDDHFVAYDGAIANPVVAAEGNLHIRELILKAADSVTLYAKDGLLKDSALRKYKGWDAFFRLLFTRNLLILDPIFEFQFNEDGRLKVYLASMSGIEMLHYGGTYDD